MSGIIFASLHLLPLFLSPLLSSIPRVVVGMRTRPEIDGPERAPLRAPPRFLLISASEMGSVSGAHSGLVQCFDPARSCLMPSPADLTKMTGNPARFDSSAFSLRSLHPIAPYQPKTPSPIVISYHHRSQSGTSPVLFSVLTLCVYKGLRVRDQEGTKGIGHVRGMLDSVCVAAAESQ